MRTKYDQDDFAVYKGITFYTYYTCSGYIGSLTEEKKRELYTEFVLHYLPKELGDAAVGNPITFLIMIIVAYVISEAGAVAAVCISLIGAGFSSLNIIEGCKLITKVAEGYDSISDVNAAKVSAKDCARGIALLGVEIIPVLFGLIKRGFAKYNGKEIKVGEKARVRTQNELADIVGRKINEAGDLIDDGNTTKVFDKDGKKQPLIHQSDNNGRQGTLEKWLGVNNANTSLMSIAGYVWDDTKKKWIVNPGQIKYDKIKEAHSTGKITDDQYNLILLAAGQSTSYDDKSEKISLINQLLTDYQKENAIKTQTQINFVNRTWEWLGRKWTSLFKKIEQKENNKKNEESADFESLMKQIKIDDLSSPCCDLYSTRVLEILNKKPDDWPNPSTYKVCNTPNYSGNNYKDFYSSKWKNTPSEGWNIMIMWSNPGEKFENSPHMAVLQKTNDTVNLTHFTGNEQIIREKYSFKNIETSFKYSNFRYMSLGE